MAFKPPSGIIAGVIGTIVVTGLATAGSLLILGNTTIYGDATARSFIATSTEEGLNVAGRSQLTGSVTTTAGITPATAGGANIGSSNFPFGQVHATGTSVLGGALTVTNGAGAGADRVQIGYEQSPAKVPGDTYRDTRPLNIYAPSTGFVDAFSMTAGGNGADGACFSARNLGAALGRQCQTSSPLGYWIMALNGLAFHSGNLTPYGPANVDLILRGGNVGIGLSSVKLPTAKLEIQGTASSTKMVIGGLAGVPGSTTDFAVVSPRTTSTVQIGSATKISCLVLGDTDAAGLTFCTALNGTLSCSTTDCR